MNKNLFLWNISQETNNDYDTYSSAVVVSSSLWTAVRIHPACDRKTKRSYYFYDDEAEVWCDGVQRGASAGADSWASPKAVTAVCVGLAADGLEEGTIVCASFHAG